MTPAGERGTDNVSRGVSGYLLHIARHHLLVKHRHQQRVKTCKGKLSDDLELRKARDETVLSRMLRLAGKND